MPGKRDRLARQRHAVGMTQEQLAAALGVERSTIYRWESGKVAPRPDVQPKLARALSVSPDELANLLMIEAGLSSAPATTGPRDASRPQQTLTESGFPGVPTTTRAVSTSVEAHSTSWPAPSSKPRYLHGSAGRRLSMSGRPRVR